jgi:hypothetical protein
LLIFYGAQKAARTFTGVELMTQNRTHNAAKRPTNNEANTPA